jgi:hypothetical protein
MGAVNTTYTFAATDTITSTKMNNIIDETTMTSDACLSGGGLEVADGKLSIAPNAINSSRLASSSVTTNAITNGNVTPVKLSAGAPNWTSGGNVDIGTGFTDAKLNVQGDIALASGNNVRVSSITSGSLALSGGTSFNATGGSIALRGSTSTFNPHGIECYAGGSERMRITASGNVGIGTSSPGFPLSMANTLGDKIAVYGSSGNHFGLGIQNNQFQIHTDTNAADVVFGYGTSAEMTETMRIKGDGNVGIGTTTPSSKLQVNGTVTATAFAGPLTGNVTGNVTGNASSASTVSNSAITAAKLDGNQSGSAPIYGCRAWVSFVGRSTDGDCTIRSSGNINRVARTAAGRYTVYFATSMQDAEYATITGSDANAAHKIAGVISQSAGEVNIAYSQIQTSTSRIDPTWGQVSIFR